MELRELVEQVEGFDALPPRERIRLFAWHLQTHKSKDSFDNAAIRGCYEELHLASPNVAAYLPRFAATKPPDLVKVKGGYKLERSVRSALDAKYLGHESAVRVSRILSDLPGKVPDTAEKVFLTEALSCYRVKAYRACIVMAWNLAFDHLLNWILSDPARLAAFNTAITRRYAKRTGIVISKHEHFEEFKEFEVIEICQTASLASKNVIEILREKLKKRNAAAHPSQVVFVQSQADDVVTDLINNVVLALIKE
jgi:hypothetical protein